MQSHSQPTNTNTHTPLPLPSLSLSLSPNALLSQEKKGAADARALGVT